MFAKEPFSAFSSVTSSISGICSVLKATISFSFNSLNDVFPFLQHCATRHSAPKGCPSVAAHPLQVLHNSQFVQSIPQIDFILFSSSNSLFYSFLMGKNIYPFPVCGQVKSWTAPAKAIPLPFIYWITSEKVLSFSRST